MLLLQCCWYCYSAAGTATVLQLHRYCYSAAAVTAVTAVLLVLLQCFCYSAAAVTAVTITSAAASGAAAVFLASEQPG